MALYLEQSSSAESINGSLLPKIFQFISFSPSQIWEVSISSWCQSTPTVYFSSAPSSHGPRSYPTLYPYVWIIIYKHINKQIILKHCHENIFKLCLRVTHYIKIISSRCKNYFHFKIDGHIEILGNCNVFEKV